MIQFLFKTCVLVVAFGGMAFVGYGVRMTLFPPKEVHVGAELKVMCLKCGNIETARVTEIRSCFCSKCGNPVGEAWRCRDCGKVFPFVMRMPKNRAAGKRGLQDWAEMHRCPHCQSLRTEPVPLTEETPKSGKPAKPGTDAAPPPVDKQMRGVPDQF
jgi:hypothetical protein